MAHHVLVGITSGIAAYKVLDLLKKITDAGYDVDVIETKHAMQMLPPPAITAVIQKPIHSDLFPSHFDYTTVLKDRVVDHIALADKTSVFVIAPATANTLAKLAHGLADDFLTTTALAVTAPLIVCPSMNVNMWNNPVTQTNIALLQSRGVIIIGPEEGPLACGYEGKGRLASIDTIFTQIDQTLRRSRRLKGKRVVITGGGTHEPLDDVRIITNRSTGKMAVALAEACWRSGADVMYLHSENAELPRYQMKLRPFSTADSLAKALHEEAQSADYIFHAAAVSDFTVEKVPGKISSDSPHTITLVPRDKILHKLHDWSPRAFIAGFKAVHSSNREELVAIGEEKRRAAGVQAIIVNDVSKKDRGFGADTNEVIIIQAEHPPIHLPLQDKKRIAERILDTLLNKAR